MSETAQEYSDYLEALNDTQAVEIEQHHIAAIEEVNIDAYDMADDDREPAGEYYLDQWGQPVDLEDWESEDWDAALGMCA